MSHHNVPNIVISRLPLYLRALTMIQDAGKQFTSSQQLGKQLGIGSAQIRKDLAHFGEFGKQGTGYEIQYLVHEIRSILKIDRRWAVAVVGFGGLGHAISSYSGFPQQGFHVEAIFDNDASKVGIQYHGATVQHINDLPRIITEKDIKIGVIATPAPVAQNIADLMVNVGIRAILNYAPITITVPKEIKIQYIDPVVHLQSMAYYISE